MEPSNVENVELARTAYEAFVAGDPGRILDFLDPEIVAHDFANLPDTAVYHGRDGFLALVTNVLQEFEDFRIEAEEFTAPDHEHVIVVVRTVGRGRESGAEVEARVAHLWRVRNGKGIELWLHGSREEALASL